VWGIDLDSTATGADADKVLECDGFLEAHSTCAGTVEPSMSQGRLGITSQAARVVVKQPEMTMKTKPLPDPLYGCSQCADEYSKPATELFWSERTCSWVCDNCWSAVDEHWLTDNDLIDRGITLADELKKRGLTR
jgi:hypothetical protein